MGVRFGFNDKDEVGYVTLARADGRTSRSCAEPLSVPSFTTSFPANHHSPDSLL
jgi:hypothetical protein